MDLRHPTDGIYLDRKDPVGRDASVPLWLAADSRPHFPIERDITAPVAVGTAIFTGP